MEYTFEAQVDSVSRISGTYIDDAGNPQVYDRASWDAHGGGAALMFDATFDAPAPPVGTRFTVTLVAIEEN